MLTLAQLMSRVAERKGYAVQGADEGALLARKGDEKLLVAWSLDNSVTTADASLFLAAIEQIAAQKGILVAPKGIDEAAKDLLASRKTIEVWAESRLVVEVGEALVKHALENPDVSPPPANAPAAGPSAPPATVAAAAQRSGNQRTTSLIGRAVASSGKAHDPGTVMFMPSKPTRQLATGASVAIQQKGQSLGYVWGGVGGTSSPGVAQVRNGRRPQPAGTPVPTAAPAPSSALAAADDVELITTPRRRAPPAQAPAAPAPMMVPEDTDSELITTPRRPAPVQSAPMATVAQVAQAAPPVTSLSASLATADADEEEEYEIISTPRKAKPAASETTTTAAAPEGSTWLRVRHAREHAFSKASVKGGASINLALVPHVAFEYDVHMEREGMVAPVVGKGVILVSSMTGELRTVDTLEFGEEPAGARKDPVKLQAVDVYDKVKAHISKTFTKSVNTERELAGNTVMETVKLTPDLSEMGLNHRGIVHVPVWETVTAEGPVRIDAYTGQRL